MGPIHLRARYDGHVLVPEEPIDLPQGMVLEFEAWAADGSPTASEGSEERHP